MFRLRTRTAARRRALSLVVMLVFVWCQIAAVAQSSVTTVGAVRGSHVTAPMTDMAGAAKVAAKASDMTAPMVGCHGAGDPGDDGDSKCPSKHATSDWAKLPVFLPLPPAPFALVRAHERAAVGVVRYELPQGRAPPRSRLCSWLI